MADKTDSRGSRRRVLLAAILLLVVGAFAVWRTSNKSDPRFVGRWFVDYEVDSPWKNYEWELNADGTGAWRTRSDRQLRGLFKWTVSGGHMTTTPQPTESGLDYLKVKSRQAYLIALDDPSSGQTRYRFTWVNPGVCELDFEPKGDQQDMPSIRLIRIDASDSALRPTEPGPSDTRAHPVQPHE